MKLCTITGMRPIKLPGGYDPENSKKLLWEIHRVIVDHIENKGVTVFLQGLCLGIDVWSAMIVLKLKEKYPYLQLISAIPCRNHSKQWPDKSQREWQYIVDNSDEATLVTDEEYKPYMMQLRNLWMLDRCDYVIGVHDGSLGGTYNCLEAAKKKNKEITIINPKDFK